MDATIAQLLAAPSSSMNRRRHIVNITNYVLPSSTNTVLLSMLASETDLLYVLHDKGYTEEEWLAEGPAPDVRDLARQGTQMDKLPDFIRDLATWNYKLLPQTTHPR